VIDEGARALLAQLDTATSDRKGELEQHIERPHALQLTLPPAATVEVPSSSQQTVRAVSELALSAAAPPPRPSQFSLLSSEQKIEAHAAATDQALQMHLSQVAPNAELTVQLPDTSVSSALLSKYALGIPSHYLVRDALALEQRRDWLAAARLWQKAVQMDGPSGLAHWKLANRHFSCWAHPSRTRRQGAEEAERGERPPRCDPCIAASQREFVRQSVRLLTASSAGGGHVRRFSIIVACASSRESALLRTRARRR
jgi:hypothetical protein